MSATVAPFQVSPVRVTSPLYWMASIPLTLRSMYIRGRFVNPFPTWRDKTLWDFCQWRATRTGGNGLPQTETTLQETLPVVEPSWESLYPSPVPSPHTPSLTTPPVVNSGAAGSMDASWVMQFSVLADKPNSVPTGSSHANVTAPAASGSTDSDNHVLTSNQVTVTWLGQSTCYVQLPGLNILTDPIFQARTVTSWLGPKRLRPIPCQLEQLRVDVVLVSHNHYDHLDLECVRKLGNTVLWFVPLGMRAWFVRNGIQRVVEMDWWQFTQVSTMTPAQTPWLTVDPVTCTSSDDLVRHTFHIGAIPAQHWSGRTPLDSNCTLWCGWAVRRVSTDLPCPSSDITIPTLSPRNSSLPLTSSSYPIHDVAIAPFYSPGTSDQGSFFHCGDTGYYAPLFRTIGQAIGPVTLAALPIGSYQPRWYMHHQHIDPADAVLIHEDLRAHRSIGVHWATFMLSDEDYLDPPRDLVRALLERGQPAESFVTTHIGQTLCIPTPTV
ncbi:beta-lactamase superfamily domain-containing protein [Dimargaris cristalligena]|uniref:Beta-lactamase superfamily domain-containing protein n=1 Tax=Dimargaris cristalligena TaxID=215637 RepID=A0A4P9ZX61_9FUNG|nr:beta-lactamase superfamily domain-containing protein [Dimargaris cristalligena]|eukprot:RKP38254.1 beta-lactamase superfamily domain-containing protein [Dimargaris cristalligena]